MDDVGKGDGGGGGGYVPLIAVLFLAALCVQFFASVETWQSGLILCMQLTAVCSDELCELDMTRGCKQILLRPAALPFLCEQVDAAIQHAPFTL